MKYEFPITIGVMMDEGECALNDIVKIFLSDRERKKHEEIQIHFLSDSEYQ